MGRRRQKENQEELLERVNQTTLQMLSKSGGGSGSGGGGGRKITDLTAYRAANEMQHNNTLTVQVAAPSLRSHGVCGLPFHLCLTALLSQTCRWTTRTSAFWCPCTA